MEIKNIMLRVTDATHKLLSKDKDTLTWEQYLLAEKIAKLGGKIQ